MEQVLKVLTLYDIAAYLLPGLCVVWAFLRSVHFIQGGWSHTWSWKLVVVAYIVGHLLQAVASDERKFWRKEDDPVRLRTLEKVFPKKDEAVFVGQLKSAICDAFCDPPPREWFLLCESYVRAKKLESFVEIMQARYGFFRGLLLALRTATVMLVVAFAWALRRGQTRSPSRREKHEHLFVIALCVAAAFLSYLRKGDFYKYYSQGTYRAFYADYVLSEKNDARVPCPPPSDPPLP